MKRWIKWYQDNNSDNLNYEAVDPTDIDSKGKDQDPNSIGLDYESGKLDKIIDLDREKDEIERKYQKKIFELMKKKDNKDINDIDFSDKKEAKKDVNDIKGTLDDIIKKYLEDRDKEIEDVEAKIEKEREEIGNKIPSTAFIPKEIFK